MCFRTPFQVGSKGKRKAEFQVRGSDPYLGLFLLRLPPLVCGFVTGNQEEHLEIRHFGAKRG